MNDLQHEFIHQSVADLQSLAEKSRHYENKKLPDDLLREIFRVLHTIKGTAQVFRLPAASHLAHTLENLLAAAKKGEISSEDLKLIAPNGVEILAQMLAEKNFQLPDSFAEKIQKYQTQSNAETMLNDGLSELPAEFSGSLSTQEKSLINQMIANGSNLFVLEIGFTKANFAAEFKDFRRMLAEKGEIIASLPTAKFAAKNKIGFRIVYASGENAATIVEKSSAKIIHPIHTIGSGNLSGIFRQIEQYGKTLGHRLGKTIEFEISADAETLPPPTLKIVFDALTHLIRNAVSHAFDESGKITIEARTARNVFILKVADNGKGLDEEKIRRAAIEKNLVPTDRTLTADKLMNLIFAPDFSTAEISDVSGRGVGLEAVKTAVENAGGKISVESKTGAGTAFEIFLPKKIGPQRHKDEKTENGTDNI
jgi:two-component system chemotaxis sensor kinase CheA